MANIYLTKQDLQPLTHVPIAEPIHDFEDAFQNDELFIHTMDSFYLRMLSTLEPSVRKAEYLKELNKEIEAIIRVQHSIAVICFTDKTVHCNREEIMHLITPSQAPLKIGMIATLLRSHFDDCVSIEYFTANRPTYQDYKQGYLFNDHDKNAGSKEEEVSVDVKMCEWLQQYQLWLQDYLYFNLAQISHNPTPDLKQRMRSLSPLSQYLHAKG